MVWGDADSVNKRVFAALIRGASGGCERARNAPSWENVEFVALLLRVVYSTLEFKVGGTEEDAFLTKAGGAVGDVFLPRFELLAKWLLISSLEAVGAVAETACRIGTRGEATAQVKLVGPTHGAIDDSFNPRKIVFIPLDGRVHVVNVASALWQRLNVKKGSHAC